MSGKSIELTSGELSTDEEAQRAIAQYLDLVRAALNGGDTVAVVTVVHKADGGTDMMTLPEIDAPSKVMVLEMAKLRVFLQDVANNQPRIATPH